MSKRYQVLARKYRPQAFRDVLGQEAIVTTLKNAIRFDKIAHGYLFCGSRGVGKTTLARLFAKTLNCQALTTDLEPCNSCPSCLEIASGQSLDVIEIDGASNRGIDDVRQINETIGYAPAQGKYKIYIIDEVHMLTKEAFNALLKTLEEPPEKAKFFFATTEAHKVLPTIISRCQRFDLARIQPKLIAAKLEQIAKDLNRTVEPDALLLIAHFAEGSLRDAESLFDQILCFEENIITQETVRRSLGLVSQELFTSLDEAFAHYDLSYAFSLVDQLFQTGKDLSHFLEQLIEHYRNLILTKMQNKEAVKLYTQQQLLHILDLLIQAEVNFQKSAFQRISLESILLQIIRSKHRIPVEVLVRTLTEHSSSVPLPALVPVQDSPAPVPQPALASPEPALASTTAALEPPPLPDPLPTSLEPPPLPALIPPPRQEFVAVPFNPYTATAKPEAQPPAVQIPQRTNPQPVKKTEEPQKLPPLSNKHPSHYDVLMRFAAVELEGTIKN
jgi:DNA polymerase-3 subunit gamma/tau